MTNNVIIVIHVILGIINLIMYGIWMFRADIDYIEKHSFCPMLSFQLAGINFIMALSLAF